MDVKNTDSETKNLPIIFPGVESLNSLNFLDYWSSNHIICQHYCLRVSHTKILITEHPNNRQQTQVIKFIAHFLHSPKKKPYISYGIDYCIIPFLYFSTVPCAMYYIIPIYLCTLQQYRRGQCTLSDNIVTNRCIFHLYYILSSFSKHVPFTHSYLHHCTVIIPFNMFSEFDIVRAVHRAIYHFEY